MQATRRSGDRRRTLGSRSPPDGMEGVHGMTLQQRDLDGLALLAGA